jgi:hypothetical protein
VKSQSVEDVERYRAARDPRQRHFDFYIAMALSSDSSAQSTTSALPTEHADGDAGWRRIEIGEETDNEQDKQTRR